MTDRVRGEEDLDQLEPLAVGTRILALGSSTEPPGFYKKEIIRFIDTESPRLVVLSSLGSVAVFQEEYPVIRSSGDYRLMEPPVTFAIREDVLEVYLRKGKWVRLGKIRNSSLALPPLRVQTPVSAVVQRVLTEPVPVPPESATFWVGMGDLDRPLVGSGRPQLSGSLDGIEEEYAADGRAVDAAMLALESSLNLRPDQITAALLRPQLIVLRAHQHLLTGPLLARLKGMNRRLAAIYNSSQAPNLREAITAINDLLRFLAKS